MGLVVIIICYYYYYYWLFLLLLLATQQMQKPPLFSLLVFNTIWLVHDFAEVNMISAGRSSNIEGIGSSLKSTTKQVTTIDWLFEYNIGICSLYSSTHAQIKPDHHRHTDVAAHIKLTLQACTTSGSYEQPGKFRVGKPSFVCRNNRMNCGCDLNQ